LPLISVLQNEAIFSQVASNDTYYTGIALVNPDDVEARVALSVHDSMGQQIAGPAVTLEPKSSKAFVLSSLVPELAGRQLISGYVRMTADRPIACFALYGTHDFQALSAIASSPSTFASASRSIARGSGVIPSSIWNAAGISSAGPQKGVCPDGCWC